MVHEVFDAPLLFRVRSDIFNAVEVIRDREKEAPGFVDASLPQVPALVVLFSVERRVLARSDKTIFIAQVVLRAALFRFLISLPRKAIASPAVVKGP